MVKICSTCDYPNETKYADYFAEFSYPLHIFQKWAIEGIVEGQHVLVTAPTGSGKSLPAEFSLNYFHSKGKKTIYTSPIKALSNEKFYSFTQKYPHISIGLITGDIKTNPDADVLIMTTEILLNKLYQIKSTSHNSVCTSYISFDMDIQNELGCVIFDEIHMINDESRGHVWEQTIMMLPQHIQIVGLSATLDNPEKFANWLETKGEKSPCVKEVYLTNKLTRAVPLIHYTFITVPNSINKLIKDKATQEEIKNTINKPFVIQDAKNSFNEPIYKGITKMLDLFEKHDIRAKRQHVLNKVTEYLAQNEMLPALCYVFSRKQLEKCASELTTNLLEFDSKVPYTVDRECEQIIRKLPNYEEYLYLPEYINIVKLLRKGVGIHHAGLMPILREMVEILFAKGFIKLLFCTETMSVGINLPVKTTIFTSVSKFNGEIMRPLYSHEYTQAAGRAGRLGLDKIGHVIHLNNLFKNVELTNYKNMMNGKPQKLVSKFKFSYNLLLNLIDINGNCDTCCGDSVMSFSQKSLITDDLATQMADINHKIKDLNTELNNANQTLLYLKTPVNVIKEYIDLIKQREFAVNKKRKEIDKKISKITDNHKYVEQDIQIYKKKELKEDDLSKLHTQYNNTAQFIQNGVTDVLKLLENEAFTKKYEDNNIKLGFKGQLALQIREVPCLTFADIIVTNVELFNLMSTKQLVSFFSCFTNISVQDDFKDYSPNTDYDKLVLQLITKVTDSYDYYQKKELEYGINTGTDYNIHYDLLNYANKWCDCESVEECKLLLQEIGETKEIFLGEFVKALLKINNISNEIEKVAELTNNLELLSKLKEIPNITLKYVVTNQSLYINL